MKKHWVLKKDQKVNVVQFEGTLEECKAYIETVEPASSRERYWIKKVYEAKIDVIDAWKEVE